jgi:hypothetical protein
MPAIAWVGIGCGGLLLLAIVAGVFVIYIAKSKLEKFATNPEKAAAELMVSWNPDMEMVSQDEEKGTMTIRTKDGEEMTLSYNDIAEGRIVVTDKDGNTTRIGSADLSQVPAWVPKAPDLTDAISSYHSETSGEITGLFTGSSPRGSGDLRTFFESEATSLGLTSRSSSSMESGGTSTVSLGFQGGGKSLNIVITGKPGDGTLVNTNYSEKK